MRLSSKFLSANKPGLPLGILLFLSILFETFQRLYYSRIFNQRDDLTFFDVFKSQLYRWSIWVILALVLVRYIRSNIKDTELTLKDYLKHASVIALLIVVNILIISISNYIYREEGWSFSLLLNEYIVFFVYQRVPIYTLNFAAVAVIFYQYFAKQQLQFQVRKLIEIKDSNEQLYNELKKNIDDRTDVLSIKIGNRRKVILINDILWIQSDDYCVKVNTLDGKSYSMRTSLKSLDNKLGSKFIRVHRNAIVNLSLISEFKLSPSPYLILKGEVQVPISQRKLKEVKTYLSV